VQQTAHECSGRHHDGTCAKAHSETGLHARRRFIIHEQARHVALPKIETRLPLEKGLHAKLVRFFVALGARRSHARSLARIQHSELDTRGVGIESHHTSKGVDFTDHVPLGKSADRRIARHLADGVGVLSEHQGFTAKPRGCHRGLNSGMPRPDDNHVIRFRIFELAHF
jgi:hypothetical protein